MSYNTCGAFGRERELCKLFKENEKNNNNNNNTIVDFNLSSA